MMKTLLTSIGLLFIASSLFASSGPGAIGGLSITAAHGKDVPNTNPGEAYQFIITNPSNAPTQYMISETSTSSTAKFVAGSCIVGTITELAAKESCTFSVDITKSSDNTPSTFYKVMRLASMTDRNGRSWGVTYATSTSSAIILKGSISGLPQDITEVDEIALTATSGQPQYPMDKVAVSGFTFPEPIQAGEYTASGSKISESGVNYCADTSKIYNIASTPTTQSIIINYKQCSTPPQPGIISFNAAPNSGMPNTVLTNSTHTLKYTMSTGSTDDQTYTLTDDNAPGLTIDWTKSTCKTSGTISEDHPCEVDMTFTAPSTEGSYAHNAVTATDTTTSKITPLHLTTSIVKPTPGASMNLAPFVDMTTEADWSGETPKPSLDIFIQKGVQAQYFILAFLTQDPFNTGECLPSWGGVNTKTLPSMSIGWGEDTVKTLQANGGNVAISFGGENGTTLARECSQSDLAKVYEDTYTTYHPAFIDFDIEGGALGDTTANEKRNSALVAAQSNQPNLKVSYTLPANIDGLASQAIPLLQDAVTKGVNIVEINLMTMAWYAQKLPDEPIEKSIEAAVNASLTQLEPLFPNKTKAELMAMIRVTPRLGYDYDGSLFTFDDATNLAHYVTENKLAGISYWSLNVDYNNGQSEACSPGKATATCSGIAQGPFQYTNTFLAAL